MSLETCYAKINACTHAHSKMWVVTSKLLFFSAASRLLLAHGGHSFATSSGPIAVRMTLPTTHLMYISALATRKKIISPGMQPLNDLAEFGWCLPRYLVGVEESRGEEGRREKVEDENELQSRRCDD
jgi:hypothetical protein